MISENIYEEIFKKIPNDTKNIIESIIKNKKEIDKIFEEHMANNRNLRFFSESIYEKNGLMSNENYEIKFNKELKKILSTNKVKKRNLESLIIKNKLFDIIIDRNNNIEFYINVEKENVTTIKKDSIEMRVSDENFTIKNLPDFLKRKSEIEEEKYKIILKMIDKINKIIK